MEMQNERRLPLPRQKVWDALNDPDVLQACIPGCESFDAVDENTYDAVVNAKVGPVKARFKGRVTLEELQPPESYSMSFQGKGGQAGFVKGTSSVRLDEVEEGCRLGYSVKATLGGKLAQLGSRLVDGAAQKTANDFFDNFLRHMGVDPEAEAAAASGEAEGTRAADSGSGRPMWPWVAAAAGAAVLIAAVLLL
jgi:hypothetical protein